jgi:hypothetical protein
MGVSVDAIALGSEPRLKAIRAVRFEGGRRLLINPALTDSQRAFALAREAAYHRLGLRARSWVSPPEAEGSFDQVVNDFKSSYVAGALLLPRAAVVADLRKWFRQTRWRPEVLLELMERYQVTAETLMYRFSQLAPGEFGLRVHFLKFRDDHGDYRLVKQLNLSDLPVPPGHGGGEHYCRRWLTTRLLADLAASRQRHPKRSPRPAIGVQLSRFLDGPDEFFCLGLSLPAALDPAVNISLTLGFKVDDAFRQTVRFAADREVSHALISSTCERCPLDQAACRHRVAPPRAWRREQAREAQRRALASLRDRAI